MPEYFYLSLLLFFVIAALYSSVGHAGASGYLAIMALLSFAPDTIKPTSLILNVVVASIASFKFIQAGYFDKKIFLIFISTSIPMAFLGGYLRLDPAVFKIFAGFFLVIAALMLVLKTFIKPQQAEISPKPTWLGLAIGALIGLISGLIGVGGGIFLSPILIMSNWTTVKKASGISALFILLNSLAGLGGHITAIQSLDYTIFFWILAVFAGGLLGSHLGTNKYSNKIIIAILFLVLLTAGVKFLVV
jgi:uncharacterized membrane protein YfcA